MCVWLSNRSPTAILCVCPLGITGVQFAYPASRPAAVERHQRGIVPFVTS